MKFATIEKLLAGQIGQQLTDAVIIMAHVINQNKIFILTHPEYKLNKQKLHLAKQALRRLSAGFPVAYLTGEKDFCGLNFLVNKNTLIPRPETELMVEEADNIIASLPADKTGGRATRHPHIMLIDVGTGSGCVPIAIMKNVSLADRHKNIETIAIDISPSALRIARQNAKRHGIKIQFLQGDLLSPILNNVTHYIPPATRMIITANLPYLTVKQFAMEPSIQKEPRRALVADAKNGLTLYANMLKQVKILKARRTKIAIIIFLEINPEQATAIIKLIKKSLPKAAITIKKDLAKRERLVQINL